LNKAGFEEQKDLSFVSVVIHRVPQKKQATVMRLLHTRRCLYIQALYR